MAIGTLADVQAVGDKDGETANGDTDSAGATEGTVQGAQTQGMSVQE